jgi:hypothetical protein
MRQQHPSTTATRNSSGISGTAKRAELSDFATARNISSEPAVEPAGVQFRRRLICAPHPSSIDTEKCRGRSPRKWRSCIVVKAASTWRLT